MDPVGNGYDPATNTMTVGTVDGCLASPQANSSTHTHTAQIVVENIEDLVGWQARLNYNGDEMRPANVDFDPFLDTTTGQVVSFVNLPKDGGTSGHRHITGALAIPPAAPGPQSSLIGSVYDRTQDAPISADTPAKNPPDDTSYSAPKGGVLAMLDLEIAGDQSGHTLFMQLDNDNPNPPGSKFVVFNGTGTDDIDLAGDQLASGYHAEGAEMCGPVETPRDLVADLRVADVAVKAPASVSSGEPFDIQVGVTVENRGPDETNVWLTLSFSFPANCSGPQGDVYVGLFTLQPLSMPNIEHVESFSCYAAPGQTLSDMIYVVSSADVNADDPDTSDNARAGQVVVNVFGPGGMPTPTPPYPPPASSVADITVIGGEVSAPESVKAGEPFDIRLSVTVANEGPDDVDGELLASYGWDTSANCLTGPGYRMFWDLGHLAPSAVSQFDIRNEITCYGSSSPVTPANFYLGVTAYALAATDPNPKNNEWAVQRVVSIVGTAPMPTPAQVQDPSIDPSQVPDSTPSNPGVGGSSSSGTPEGGVSPAVAQANSQTSAVAVLAAALPQTGAHGGEGQPDWLLLLVAGGALGVTAAAVVATRRLLGSRR